jgi:urease beta subunit
MFICIWIGVDSEPVYFEDIGSDFHFAEMRKTIHNSLENKQYGSRFPVFLKTPLSYADFSPKRVEALEKEIVAIIGERKHGGAKA